MVSLKSKTYSQLKIGSVHSKLNYKTGETVFHKDDVPQDKRERKAQVIRSKFSKVLSCSQPEWNISNKIDQPGCYKRNCQVSKHDPTIYQYNYRAETLLQTDQAYVPQPRKFELDRTKLASEAGKFKVHSDRSKLVRKRTEEMKVHPKLHGKDEWDGSTVVPTKLFEVSRSFVISLICYIAI